MMPSSAYVGRPRCVQASAVKMPPPTRRGAAPMLSSTDVPDPKVALAIPVSKQRCAKSEPCESPITPHIVSGVQLDVGNERYLGDKAGKGYEEYQPITERKDLLPQAEQPAIEPKPYRDYAGFNDKADTELLIKGHRYEPK